MKDKLTTFERRIEMLFLFANCKKTTVTELSFYFDVSKDTIFRDVAFLSRYAPIYTKQGMFGGIYVVDDYKGSLKLHLSTDEKNLLEHLAETSNDADARLLRNILHKYSMPKTEV
ncbi:MAG: HTH domain-containing protein [Ruminococcaceae bacterium]|nr:HTH domain-containing protein [Oscillospiraceae bacterium]